MPASSVVSGRSRRWVFHLRPDISSDPTAFCGALDNSLAERVSVCIYALLFFVSVCAFGLYTDDDDDDDANECSDSWCRYVWSASLVYFPWLYTG